MHPYFALLLLNSLLLYEYTTFCLSIIQLIFRLFYFFYSHEKSWLIGKDSDAGRDWVQEEKGTTEDEMAGWHHWLDGCESEWTPGVGDTLQAWRAAIHGVAKSQTRLSTWSDLIWFFLLWLRLLWTFICMCLGRQVFPFLLSIYLRVELMSHRVNANV